MARYTGPVCRLCRREGMKLFLKGQRCYSEKCAIEQRNFVPGEQGRRSRFRRKIVGYGLQLREKQKVKRMYGVLENQFRLYFEKAARKKGITGELLMQFLERRLDNIVYRLGFASSRSQARQWVRHGHVMLNGRKVSIPSCLVSKGDEISIREKSQENVLIRSSMEETVGRGVPAWLQLDGENFKGRVVELPLHEDIGLPIEVSLIVELYSK
ncbi:MAG: 30S ribosomal protein S4 [Acidobacteria bacterium]|nr:30S ribosomal protein S4 [Acidobacteriota bacterium]